MFSVTWTVGALVAAFLLFWVKDTLSTDPMVAVIGMFVVLGISIDLKPLQTPMVSIWQEDGDDWLIVRRWLWKVERENVNRHRLPMPTIEEGTDGEGGKDHHCRLRIPSGVIEFGTHRRREGAERICERMRSLLKEESAHGARSNAKEIETAQGRIAG
jgi:hypothetical protein